MAIRFDASSCTVLAVCDQCQWLELVLDADEARRRAREHVWSVHPSDRQTITVLNTWTRRRAAAGGGN